MCGKTSQVLLCAVIAYLCDAHGDIIEGIIGRAVLLPCFSTTPCNWTTAEKGDLKVDIPHSKAHWPTNSSNDDFSIVLQGINSNFSAVYFCLSETKQEVCKISLNAIEQPVSNPTIKALDWDSNGIVLNVSCESAQGSLPITYSLFKNSTFIKRSHQDLPAAVVFQITHHEEEAMEDVLKCKAINSLDIPKYSSFLQISNASKTRKEVKSTEKSPSDVKKLPLIVCILTVLIIIIVGGITAYYASWKYCKCGE
uniref:IL-40-like Ig domain-containing protein n=1 Tax=Eptatretus burgeri TaxID=7764 RepID=A0A8C4QMY5_EPTBU